MKIQMTRAEARAHRANMIQAAESLDDKKASVSPYLFRQLDGGGDLIKAGSRINWRGVVKRAATDLWDNELNTPDANPNGWEDIPYKKGIRIIPETVTQGTRFGLGEEGWWKDQLYVSKLETNVWNPDQNPDAWERKA